MIAYLDSSVLLRVLLNQENRLNEFKKMQRPIASKLLKTECLRTLDRFLLRSLIKESDYQQAVSELYEGLKSVEFIEISELVLERANGHFALPLGTLDAIHLASALIWRENTKTELLFFTHDEMLGKSARLFNFEVLGIV